MGRCGPGHVGEFNEMIMKRSILILSLCATAASLSPLAFAQTPSPATNTTAAAPRRPGGTAQGADQPSPRRDKNSQIAHEQLVAKAKMGGIDIYFEGDSITRRWGTSDAGWKNNLENWNSNFFGWNAADFGWGADLTQNILWRLENGELDGVNPKIIVLLAGINNVGTFPGGDEKVENIT